MSDARVSDFLDVRRQTSCLYPPWPVYPDIIQLIVKLPLPLYIILPTFQLILVPLYETNSWTSLKGQSEWWKMCYCNRLSDS